MSMIVPIAGFKHVTQCFDTRSVISCTLHINFIFSWSILVITQKTVVLMFIFVGFTPLQCAVFCSHAEIVSTLLAVSSADVNLPLTTTVRRGVDWYEEGSTALHIACSRRHHDIVQALLNSGATPEVINRGAAEQSPLHVAAEHGTINLQD